MSNSTFWNFEEDSNIICPYCGNIYIVDSYDGVTIGDKQVDCYSEDTETYVCDNCHKEFTMFGYQSGWTYHTETIDGEMAEDEHEQQ